MRRKKGKARLFTNRQQLAVYLLATVSRIRVWTVVTNRFIKTGQSFPTFVAILFLASGSLDGTGPVAHFPFVPCHLLLLRSWTSCSMLNRALDNFKIFNTPRTCWYLISPWTFVYQRIEKVAAIFHEISHWKRLHLCTFLSAGYTEHRFFQYFLTFNG